MFICIVDHIASRAHIFASIKLSKAVVLCVQKLHKNPNQHHQARVKQNAAKPKKMFAKK
jgi:hypothetical protein